MEGPSIETDTCAFCGRPSPLNRHHIVRRSAGGGLGPTVVCCGFGSNLRDADGRYYCHGLLHAHMLHLRWDGDRWYYLRTEEPMKYDRALASDGWQPLVRTRHRKVPLGGEFGDVPF